MMTFFAERKPFAQLICFGAPLLLHCWMFPIFLRQFTFDFAKHKSETFLLSLVTVHLFLLFLTSSALPGLYFNYN